MRPRDLVTPTANTRNILYSLTGIYYMISLSATACLQCFRQDYVVKITAHHSRGNEHGKKNQLRYGKRSRNFKTVSLNDLTTELIFNLRGISFFFPPKHHRVYDCRKRTNRKTRHFQWKSPKEPF